MTTPKKPSDMTDDEIAAELQQLASEDEALRRVRRRFRADALRAVDQSVADARERLEHLYRDHVRTYASAAGTTVVLTGVADLWVQANVPEVATGMRRAIDAAPAGPEPGRVFGPMDRPEWEAARNAIHDRMALLTNEQQRREAQRDRDAADQRLLEFSRTLQ